MLFKSILFLLYALTLQLILSTNVLAEGKKGCLECMYCKQLDNSNSYSEGLMKSIRKVVIGNDNWLFRSEIDLAEDFGVEVAVQLDLKRLVSELEDKGISLVVMLQPTRGMMHYDQIPEQYGYDREAAVKNFIRYEEQLRSAGAIVPEMHKLLVEVDNTPDFFFKRDHHWTPYGSKISAEIVAEAIKKLPLYTELTKNSYVTEKGVLIPKDGTMNRALMKLCGNNFGNQYVQGYATYSAVATEEALFGDEAMPEIVLIGTSNSAQRDDDRKNYNFDGYLKEFLETDVLNLSLPGGGQDGAFIQYLLTEYDVGGPPKIIIWELPVSFALDDELMFRQIIPSIKGGCATVNDEKIVRNKLELSSLVEKQRYDLFPKTDLITKNLISDTQSLQISISDKAVKDFYILTYFENGERDKVWFRRQDIVDGGNYIMEISKSEVYKGKKITSVFLEPTQSSKQKLSIEAMLCALK